VAPPGGAGPPLTSSDPMSSPRSRALLTVAAAGLAFAAALVVFSLTRGGGPAAPASADAGLPAAPPPTASTDRRIAAYQAIVRATPRDPRGAVALSAAYLQKVRETGDAGYYTRAATLLARARRLAPRDPDALTAAGTLALARHDFRGGLRLGLAAHRAAPAELAPYPVLVDALIELGRYRAAGRTLQRLVDLRPTLASYARVSYWRELHGDLAGAVDAMRLAVSAGGDAPENVAYVETLLGNLEFERGRLAAAAEAYRLSLFRVPTYLPAEAGLAKVDAARGHLGRAIDRLRDVVARLPLPEYAIALGEDELAAGRPAAGRRDLALIGAEERLLRANGVNTDVDLALYEASHGDAARAVALARRAWAQAPSVRAADAQGWALTRAGRARAGLRWARRALALGSADPSFLMHAGFAAHAAGRPLLARRWLAAALARNPRFSPYWAPRVRRALGVP
jgi:tetratricopeptide (TPR) repeat protein